MSCGISQILIGDLIGEDFGNSPNYPLFVPVFSTAIMRERQGGAFRKFDILAGYIEIAGDVKGGWMGY